MISSVPITLSRVFLKMHLRDRQAIMFSLFFPIAFMLVFGFTTGNRDPIELGVVNNSQSELADKFIETLNDNPLFSVTEGGEEDLRAALIEGDSRMVLILPAEFQDTDSGSQLRLLVDLAQTRQLSLI
ncbi:MAG: ABC transporter permease, partial [Gammaproteobacteria bacterium]